MDNTLVITEVKQACTKNRTVETGDSTSEDKIESESQIHEIPSFFF